jgi:uncharacterized protein YndB with AHSA1/START domain
MNTIAARPVLTNGRTIEREIVIAAPAARIFAALTAPEQLERWFTTTATGTALPGEPLRYFWEGDGHVDGHYVEVSPPERLVYEWHNPPGTTRISIVLTPESDGTLLNLTVIGYGDGEDWDALYNGESQGWGPLLGALKRWVETGEPTSWLPGTP